MRFIAAQFDALLTNDLWLDNARHANAMAAQLAAAFGDVPAVEVMRVPQSNSVFARIPPQIVTPLRTGRSSGPGTHTQARSAG